MKTTSLAARLTLPLLLLFGPAGCGLKGDLYLPEDEPPAGATDASANELSTETPTQEKTEDKESRDDSPD